MPRKPWRTVIVPPQAGRFTDKQLVEAIRVVKERRERRERRMNRRSSGEGVESSRSREAQSE